MTFAAVGIFSKRWNIDCWKWKYKFLQKDQTHLFQCTLISPGNRFGRSLHSLPFHPVMQYRGSAAGNVLKELYGNNIHLIDSAHYGRHRDDLRNADFKPRSFDS